MKKNALFIFLFSIAAIMANAQCKYCNSYEDYVEGRWQQLDTIYCKSHSKNHQVWVGGSDFTLTTGNKATDKILKNDAFAVMQGDTLYVNFRNLRYEKARFGNGYAKARCIGRDSLVVVSRINGSEAQEMGNLGYAFGITGAYISSKKQVQQQVCYLISHGADNKGHIAIRLMDNSLMDKMLANRKDLYDEYHTEKNISKRLLATHVLPILEKGGFFSR